MSIAKKRYGNFVNKIQINEISNDLKEFGVDTNEPDLFNSDNQNSNSEDLFGSSEEETDDDELEIPAFLRRQKN